MKLLFDQNISFRVIMHIKEAFPEASQVRDLGLHDANDIDIWRFAKENDYSIVSFDRDFLDIISYHGHPPKLILLRTGNMKTMALAELLLSKKEVLADFLSSKDNANIACLEIN